MNKNFKIPNLTQHTSYNKVQANADTCEVTHIHMYKSLKFVGK